jgi:hypothetical protein
MERIVARDQNRVQETSEEKLSSLLPLSRFLSIATRDNCKRQEKRKRELGASEGNRVEKNKRRKTRHEKKRKSKGTKKTKRNGRDKSHAPKRKELNKSINYY